MQSPCAGSLTSQPLPLEITIFNKKVGLGCSANYGMYYFSTPFLLLTPLLLDGLCEKLDNEVQGTLWPVIRLYLNLLLS